MNERLDDCIAVVTEAPDLQLHASDVLDVSVQTGGLFNFLLKVQTTKGTFFFKQYLEDDHNATFSDVPQSPATQRATLAYEVQRLATNVNADAVPRICHFDAERNAFLMEPARGDANLIDYLSEGTIPEVATTQLPKVLARLHRSTYGQFGLDSIYANREFRDFKLKIQYDNLARVIEGDEAQIIVDTKLAYQRRAVCVVHGDPNSRNVMVGEGQMGLYDFEQSHLGGPEYDIAYVLCEMWIAAEYFGRKPEHLDALKQFLDSYFEEFDAESREQIEVATSNHLATQIIYRFVGPSRTMWTFYIPEGRKGALIQKARQMLSYSPAPVSDLI